MKQMPPLYNVTIYIINLTSHMLCNYKKWLDSGGIVYDDVKLHSHA